MKHSPDLINKMVNLKHEGYSSRQIADILQIGKSTVNDAVKRTKHIYPSHVGPKIGLLDLETSAAKAYCFGRFDVNLTQAHIAEEGGKILVGGWQWLHEDTQTMLYMTPEEIEAMNDGRITGQLYDLYEEADAIVMHYGKKFDHLVVQTRGLAHGFGKLPTVKIIDTHTIAKKYLKLPNYKLDTIAAYFGLTRKIQNSGIELWIRVQNGDPEAMQEMVDYCAGDLITLKEIFIEIARLGIDGFNAAQYYPDLLVRCKVCGSCNVEPTGRFSYTATGKFEEHSCGTCGTISRSRINKTTREDRKKLLA